MPGIFSIIFFLLIFCVLYLFANRSKKAALKGLSAFLTGSVSKFPFRPPTFIGGYQGFKLSVILVPADRYSPDFLHISLAKSSTFKLTIYKESLLSNLGKRVGIVHEVKTNDEIFDKEFLTFSNRPAQAMAYLNNAGIKNAIRELFNNGFNAVSIGYRRISIQKPECISGDLQPENLTPTLQKLSLLAGGL